MEEPSKLQSMGSLSQGASRAAPGKSGLHARGERERVLVEYCALKMHGHQEPQIVTLFANKISN